MLDPDAALRILAVGVREGAHQLRVRACAQLCAHQRRLLGQIHMAAYAVDPHHQMRRQLVDLPALRQGRDLPPGQRPAGDRPANHARVGQRLDVLPQLPVADLCPWPGECWCGQRQGGSRQQGGQGAG
ncbi:hypothetical protein [Hankyongella ginsenosidimutans]|uniref:hypothetical protein n=1 Tax=Hankyongella ginsenosidimutans TaxID=1763828 RepID=UPI001CA344DC|nr:hypothetical protein [Hankyongella ginsenosidimutans]